MKRITAITAIALLAFFILTGCNPGGNGAMTANSASSIMKAMTEAIDGTNPGVTTDGNTFKVDGFQAADGTKIAGTITVGPDGLSIESAELWIVKADGSAGPVFKLVTENGGGQDIIYGVKPISPSSVPKPMTREQKIIFAILMEGYEEAYDELVEDIFDDLFERYEERPAGTYAIEETFPLFQITGTVTVDREEWDDDRDDTEVVAVDISSFSFELFNGARISGSFKWSEERDTEKADVDLVIENYASWDDSLPITLERIAVNASVSEGDFRNHDDV
ncbi:MAG: hypothetical protein IAA97_01455, partial [Spirochaetes bacterium]|nr:hypothetical protein [Candidatus Ornithospirochaeta stercoripullorum]